MSFPSEIQSSIRAQLADCLVGVVCQRLFYLPQFQIRVPQCEVLIANSSAKSNIRNGQLSQIATSIQTGGEEGMWSFERYQRWIEQKKDWAKPKQEVTEDAVEAKRSSLSLDLKRPIQQTTKVQAVLPSAKKSMTLSRRELPSNEGRIEILTADDDLEILGKQLAEKFSDDKEE
jgi:twitching motility protein PilT